MQTTKKPKGLAKIWREIKRPFRMLRRHKWIGPDQWNIGGEGGQRIWKIYEELVTLDRHQLQDKYPTEWKRIEPVCSFSTGIVLEIGCAIGNITRWLNEMDTIEKIYCVDIFEAPIIALKERGYIKAVPIVCDVIKDDLSQWIKEDYIDTITLCEIIEHFPLCTELDMLQAMKKYIRPRTVKKGAMWGEIVTQGTKYVVSTPIGFMPDPHHCRGFSKKGFIAHLEKYYGTIDSIHYNGIQQTACGWFY